MGEEGEKRFRVKLKEKREGITTTMETLGTKPYTNRGKYTADII